jgi:hypothetical protein
VRLSPFYFPLFLIAVCILSVTNFINADQPVDNFEDNNFTAESWDNAVWTGLNGGTNPAGQGAATRVNANDILAISAKDADLIAGNEGLAFEFDDSILESPATLLEYRAQALTLFLARSSAFDASSFQYVRFTAWDTSQTPPPAGARFAIFLSENILEPTYYGVPPTSFGPIIDPDGDGPMPAEEGLTLTSEPRTYLVPLDALGEGQFADQVSINTRLLVFATTGDQGGTPTMAPGPVDLSRIWNMGLGYFRTEADAESLMSASFAIDDIAFLSNAPGISVSSNSLNTVEGGAAVTFDVVLNALPASDVIISLINRDKSEGTLSVNQLTFTPDNWATSQTVTLTPADDSFIDGNVSYQIELGAESNDTLYDELNPVIIDVTNNDDGTDTTPVEDLLIDNFEDMNFDLEAWGNGQWIAFDGGANPEGLMTATRSNSNAILAVSRKAASLEPGNDGTVFQAGPGSIIASDTPEQDQRYQGLTLSALRPNAFDASVYRYLRFRAWNNDPAPAGASFFVALAENPLEPTFLSFPPVSLGPWSGDDLGLDLSDEPTDYLIDLHELRNDPLVDELGLNNRVFAWDQGGQMGPMPTELPGIANLGSIWSLAFGYQRRGADAESLMATTFSLDEIGFLSAAPGISTSESTLQTIEGDGTAAFSVTLNALPIRDVTVIVRSTDQSEGTVSPASLTFTPANWDQPQFITVTPVDDVFIDGDATYSITLTGFSDDQLYNEVSAQSVEVINADDGLDTTEVRDLVLDEFEDNNFVLENWDNAEWITFDGGANPQGLMTAARANSNGILAVSRKDASLEPNMDGIAFQGGPDAILASDTPEESLRYQSLTLSSIRPSGFDASIYRYIRFRARAVDPVPSGASFIVSFAQNPLEPTFSGFPPVSVGPWFDDGPTSGLGVELTDEAQDFLVDFETLRADPILDELGLNNRIFAWDQGGQIGPMPVEPPGSADLGDVWSLGFGLQRSASDAGSLMSGTFLIDDIALLANQPGVSSSATTITVQEGEAPATISFTLAAQPVRDVVVFLRSTDPSEGVLSLATLTFTPANWDTSQDVNLVPVQDMFADGDRDYEITIRTASDDQLFNDLEVESILATTVDDGADTQNQADALVDNFEDNDFTAQPWDSVWIAFDGAANPIGQATASRTNSNGILAVSRRDASLIPAGGGTAYQMGPGTILFSDPADQDLRYQGLSLGTIRTNSFDATPYRYLRFKAWNLAPAPTGAKFTVALTQSPLEPTFNGVPPASYGPWSGDDPATDLGLDITATPTDYIVDITDFRIDPLAEEVGLNTRLFVWDQGGQQGPEPIAPGLAALGDIWTLNFGYQRRGDDADNNMSANFVIDDIAFVAELPGIVLTPDAQIVYEADDQPTSVSARLASRPVNDVTVTISSSDPAQATVSGGMLTFTPENWNVYQVFEVSAVDDMVEDGDVEFDLNSTFVSDDQLYDGITPDGTTLVAGDNEDLAPVVESAGNPLVIAETTTGTVQISLSAPPSSPVNVSGELSGDPDLQIIGASDFTITNANWDVPFVVTIQALGDSDFTDGAGELTLQFTGGLTDTAVIFVQEDDFGVPSGIIAN